MTAIDRAPLDLPSDRDPRPGQATLVEQSRAVAEVQAAVTVAQRLPRDQQAAIRDMEASCRMPELADRAYFSYRRGGSAITGPSVYLARELGRCWRNVQYGIAELAREDDRSEMQAWAWDLETNVRVVATFIVPHRRDKDGGTVPLEQLRDVYENNANQGARRLRECILNVLPPWYVERGKALASQTLKDGGGVPLVQRVARALEAYAALGVTEDDLTGRLGKPTGKWSDHDMGQLRVLLGSLQRGELDRDEEFPGLSVDDLRAEPAPARRQRAARPAAAASTAKAGPEPAGSSDDYPAPLVTLLGPLGLLPTGRRPDVLALLSFILEAPVEDPARLTSADVARCVSTLAGTTDDPEERALQVADMIGYGRSIMAGEPV